jgi:hypothetical protein
MGSKPFFCYPGFRKASTPGFMQATRIRGFVAHQYRDQQ